MSRSGKVSRTFEFLRFFGAAEKMIENWNWKKGASPIVTLLEVTSSSLRTWLNVVFFHIFHFLSFSSLLLLKYMDNKTINCLSVKLLITLSTDTNNGRDF